MLLQAGKQGRWVCSPSTAKEKQCPAFEVVSSCLAVHNVQRCSSYEMLPDAKLESAADLWCCYFRDVGMDIVKLAVVHA